MLMALQIPLPQSPAMAITLHSRRRLPRPRLPNLPSHHKLILVVRAAGPLLFGKGQRTHLTTQGGNYPVFINTDQVKKAVSREIERQLTDQGGLIHRCRIPLNAASRQSLHRHNIRLRQTTWRRSLRRFLLGRIERRSILLHGRVNNMAIHYPAPKGTRGNPWRALQCRAQFPHMKHLKLNARFAGRPKALPGDFVIVNNRRSGKTWLGAIQTIGPDFRHIFVVAVTE